MDFKMEYEVYNEEVFSDYDDDLYEVEEESIRRPNWKGKVFDDDSFENDCDWESSGIQHLCARSVKERVTPTRELRVLELKKEVIPEPEIKYLTLSEDGWDVKKVKKSKETKDFPNILTKKFADVKQTKTTIPRFNKKSSINVTLDFFSPTKEVKFVELKPKIEVPKIEVPTHGNDSHKNDSHKSEKFKLCRNPSGCSCAFAHTVDEYTPLVCRFQDSCSEGEKCRFKHDDETKEEYMSRTNKRFITVAKEEEKPVKTQMCKFGKDCKRKECFFAHNLNELTPTECKFQDDCKNAKTCRFKHGYETKESYVKRIKNL